LLNSDHTAGARSLPKQVATRPGFGIGRGWALGFADYNGAE